MNKSTSHNWQVGVGVDRVEETISHVIFLSQFYAVDFEPFFKGFHGFDVQNRLYGHHYWQLYLAVTQEFWQLG